ncbi:MAG: hypothetical protein R3F50_16765 [Gammaproteobacteria bacterium]|jgi:hypothetical protein
MSGVPFYQAYGFVGSVQTLRIEFVGRPVGLRRVAVELVEQYQGYGYGPELIRRSKRFVIDLGISGVKVSVGSDDRGFLLKPG